MKKVLRIAAIAFSAIVFASCGTPSERSVTVSDVDISGFIKDYIEVADGTYTFIAEGYEASISVKLRLKEKPDAVPVAKGFAKIRLNAIGESGNVFDTGIYGFDAQDTEFDKIVDLLSGKADDTKTVSFKWAYYGGSKEIGKKIFTEAASFELIDKGFDPDSWQSQISPERDSRSGNSSDWDSVLDEYEKYVNKYISYTKKIANGDMSAMGDLASLLDSIQKFEDKLENVTSELSSAQASRYARISSKFVSAML